MISVESVLKLKPSFRGSFIGGRWALEGRPSGRWEIVSPANADWILPSLSYSIDHIDEAIGTARKAFRTWKQLDIKQRIAAVRRFGEELTSRADVLARMISLETGKPLEEALGEVSLLPAKIKVTIEDALPLVEGRDIDLGGNAGLGQMRWLPKGVLLVIGPFNFPVHLAHGHIVPSLLAGNVVILKPSEKTAYSAQIYTEAAEAAGLPVGVFQMIQGPGDLATRLVRDPGIDGILATCSYEIGVKIRRETVESPGKIVALEMGGKNAAIVSEGADLDAVAQALVKSAFLTTGQRCTALSRVYVHRPLAEDLAERVHVLAKELVIGQPFDTSPTPFMGPLISSAAKDKFLRYSQIAETEKARAIMRPKALEGVTRQNRRPLPQGHYVSPSIHFVDKWNAKSNYQNHEIFGPDLFFAPIDSVEEGIAAVNSSSYGLVFSLFGGNEALFDKVSNEIECGLTYWNRPTIGASARLPFGGWKHSGNHRPAGVFAIYSSVQVQSRIRTA